MRVETEESEQKEGDRKLMCRMCCPVMKAKPFRELCTPPPDRSS